MSESVPEKDKNTFKHFSSFMANNQKYLIPLDSQHFKDSLITEELLHHIMHGRQRAILKYDFSALEEQGDKIKNNLDEVMQIYDD
jgi:hypothetical protein